jgi:hypothetical protein
VEFCFLRVRRSDVCRSVVATGALAFLLTGVAGSSLAAAQETPAASAQAGAPGQAAAKNWKDRDEYDLYLKISQTQDPKQQIQLLQTWQDKYPQTDYATDRLTFWVLALSKLAQSDPQAAQQLVTKANDLLKADPKNFRAAYFITLYGPRVGGASPTPDVQSEVDAAAHALLNNPPPKPPNVKDEDWNKAKNQFTDIAYGALAWDDVSKKDLAGAEDTYKQSLTNDPTQGSVSASYAKLLYEDKKIPQALFEYARAGSYDGPGALPDADRQRALSFFKTAYQNYHGSADGADQILAQAKTSALPPDGFAIVSANETATKQADVLNDRIAKEPAFKIWYAIKQNVQDKGQGFFDSDVKDLEIPGPEAKTFSGTVVSLDPADHPTKVLVGVEDPAKPDATLEFSQSLPAEALETVKPGAKIDFSGVAESFVKDPYMLVFKDPTIPGVKTTAPAKTGKARRKH